MEQPDMNEGFDSEQDDATDDATSTVRQLRDWGKSLEDDLKAARAQLRAQAFELAGFDPNQGVGKLMAEAYRGDPTVDAIRAFAEEHGLSAQAGVATPPPASPDPAPDQTIRADTQGRVDAVMGTADPVEDNDLTAKVNRTEADMLAGQASVGESIASKLDWITQNK